MARRITPDQLAQTLDKILEEYKEDTDKTLEEVTKRFAEKGAQALRSASGVFKGKEYRKGWTAQSETTRYGTTWKIWNKTKPGLPHLLEYGWLQPDGRRWTGRTHIAPIEDEIVKAYEQGIKVELSK